MCDIAIVGGGAAGMTVAALLRRTRPRLDIVLVEPSDRHYYQPGWTLVGAGQFRQQDTVRPTIDLVPDGVRWLRQRVVRFAPDENAVCLQDGSRLQYRFLVVAAGLQLDWEKIKGLPDALGRGGVTSNYSYDHCAYTWKSIRAFQSGRAVFTQPAMPIKCAGAPQKILYMAADYWRRHSKRAEPSFALPGAAVFGVPFYGKALDRVMADYGVSVRFGHNLVGIDAVRRIATFERVQGESRELVEQRYDFLHVVPPQSAPDFIKASALADAAGWVDVDKHSLRHRRYQNVFALGDCASTPNSKTAAAVRAQARVVLANLTEALGSAAESKRYDGYASCPLTTSMGRIMLAEFGYDGVVAASFPADPRVPRKSYWLLKKHYLPRLYWRMLRGDLGPDWHRFRKYPESLPDIRP